MNQPLCSTSDLGENQAQEFPFGESNVLVVNWHGEWFAYRNSCPHANWPLNIQPGMFFDIDNKFLQCSNHMALFDIQTGECKAGPCIGDRLEPIDLEVRNGQIFAEFNQQLQRD